MNVFYFWPLYGLSTTIVGQNIQRELDQIAPPTLRRRHGRVPHITAPFRFRLALPRGFNLTDEAFNSYFSRFVLYPAYARFQQADIFHIIDDHNGNLVRVLEARRCIVTFNHAVPSILEKADGVPANSYAMRMFKYTFESILRARFVVTASEYVRQVILREYAIAPERVVANPYGYDDVFHPRDAEVRQRVRATYQWNPDWFLLLNVGSHSPRKNIETVLSALAQLPDPFHFVRLGDDWTESQRQIIERHGLQPRVHHLPFLPSNQQAAEIYGAADLFVHPALAEGFGLTLVEAMATGLPLITSNCGVMAEVAGPGAELVDPRDAAGLANAIRAIADHPEHSQRLREAGLERVKAFSWRRHVGTLLDLYRMIEAEKPKPVVI